MKQISLFGLLFLNVLAFGQAFTLEHHYAHGAAYPVDLDSSGKKYVLPNRTTNQVEFYNPDHTLWKSIPVPVTNSFHLQNLWYVSETTINPDADLEIAYQSTFGDLTSIWQSSIISESGSVLMPTATQAFLLSR